MDRELGVEMQAYIGFSIEYQCPYCEGRFFHHHDLMSEDIQETLVTVTSCPYCEKEVEIHSKVTFKGVVMRPGEWIGWVTQEDDWKVAEESGD